MELKFYLNKFLKVDNIENYSLDSLYALKKVYDQFTDKTEGFDPDFPMMSVGGKEGKGQTLATGKNNIYKVAEDMGTDVDDVKDQASLGFSSYDSDNFTLRK